MNYVVDAIMGSGKTSASINFMNSHYKDRRFLYIVPYNKETERIKNECPMLDFAIPANTSKHGNYTKSGDLKNLVSEGRNVAMSHELYCIAKQEVFDIINRQGYTIIIDEVVDVLRAPALHTQDIDILVRAGYVVPDESLSTDKYTCYKPADIKYEGSIYKDTLRLARSRRLVGINDAPLNIRYYCWMLDKDMFECAVDTYVMTYLFEGSPMYGYFKVYNIEYKKIGVKKTPAGYQFTEHGELPEMARHLRDYIEVLEHKKMNAIGDRYTALSATWYSKQPKKNKDAQDNGDPSDDVDAQEIASSGDNGVYWTDGLDILRRHLLNYYKHIHPCARDDRLWTTFIGCKKRVSSPGFSQSCIAWNTRATNDYGNRTVLAFLVNIFINPSLKIFLDSKGVPFEQDQYALAALVQWIWRSAIRNGGKVYLYLPSSRMRRLLYDWMDSLEAADVFGDQPKLAS